MKTFITIICVFNLFFTDASKESTVPNHFTEANVYICNGKSSKKYHYSKSCRGLSNCKSSITSMSLDEAEKIGRTLCGWED